MLQKVVLGSPLYVVLIGGTGIALAVIWCFWVAAAVGKYVPHYPGQTLSYWLWPAAIFLLLVAAGFQRLHNKQKTPGHPD